MPLLIWYEYIFVHKFIKIVNIVKTRISSYTYKSHYLSNSIALLIEVQESKGVYQVQVKPSNAAEHVVVSI